MKKVFIFVFVCLLICRIGFLIYHIFVFSGIEDWDEKKREVGSSPQL